MTFTITIPFGWLPKPWYCKQNWHLLKQWLRIPFGLVFRHQPMFRLLFCVRLVTSPTLFHQCYHCHFITLSTTAPFLLASCPQAASISLPLLLLMFTITIPFGRCSATDQSNLLHHPIHYCTIFIGQLPAGSINIFSSASSDIYNHFSALQIGCKSF